MHSTKTATTTLTLRTSALALAATLALAGCNANGDTATFDDEPGQQQSTQEDVDDAAQTDAGGAGGTTVGTGTAEGSDEDDVSAQSAQQAGIDLRELGEPIATTRVPARIAEDDEATMDVSIYRLERQGETLVGTFSFRVNSEHRFTSATNQRLYDYLGSGYWNPFLVDTQNLNRHDVLKHSAVEAKTDVLSVRMQPGQIVYGYAVFAAPPADVDTMSVNMVDGAPAVEVPIQ
ncbi:hypothetical protein ACQBAT_12205 [Ornithinimicrobium sp. Y1847]|uniref:hypothetical protein n=1 Tax=Ornithinimicrobium sp. Y1847 TaxID=3405419 RepID=UPI003B66E865